MIGGFIDNITMIISVCFMSALIGVTIYVLTNSWEEGKERYLEREALREIDEVEKKREDINKRRLENLKLENLEIKLTNEDMELLKLMTGNNGTARGTLRNILREHLRG